MDLRSWFETMLFPWISAMPFAMTNGNVGFALAPYGPRRPTRPIVLCATRVADDTGAVLGGQSAVLGARCLRPRRKAQVKYIFHNGVTTEQPPSHEPPDPHAIGLGERLRGNDDDRSGDHRILRPHGVT